MASAISGIAGLRGTGQFDTDHRPTNYRQVYTLLEPNGDAPLQALLSMTKSESTDDPKYNNFRDHLPDRAMVVNGAVADTTTTAVVLDDSDENAFIVAGTILVNINSGEVMHVSAYNDATNTVTVERNIGGTSETIADDDELFIAGFAAAEGADTPTPISFDSTVAYNYTQIFRFAFSLTRTMQHTYLRTGSKEQEMREKSLKLHMADIERAMFFGIKHEKNGTTANPTRFTGGILNEITGITDLDSASTANTMTEDEFDRLLIDDVFAWGSKEKLAFVGPKVAGHMQALAKDRWAPTSVEGTYGVSFVRYKTFAGDILMHVHPQFRQIPQMQDAAIFLDFPYIRYRYLEGSDTSLLKNRQDNGVDAVTHEWLTECGMELLQDMPHHAILNWENLVAP